MDTVVLKNNVNKKLGIFQFMKMSEEERDNLKGKISCEKCGANARYRKEGSDGRIACFYAIHIGKCDNRVSKKSESEEADVETNKIELDTSVYKVKWNYKISKVKGDEEIEESEESEVLKNKKKYTKNPAKFRQASISLSQILKFAEANIIEEQEILINLNKEEGELSKLVFEFNKIDNSHIDQKKHFYWGSMKYINGNYINIKNCNKVSILIDHTILNQFDERHKKKLFDVIKNNSVIVFGKVIKTSKGNFLVKLDAINEIYFRKK
ncbi:hypothetical protein [Paenibacillus sp. AD87]|uniref:hypothetical protein n=1 Tax=Paenibacillus sp. AD87 TaxID=1528787 RepID=UPI0007E3AEA6|nr:hypothetical protein [Paenibacillus sp. AD87]OAX50261.1 hypothetical protein gpAD87_18860 [Paenibacillus sp. AD87]